MQLLTAEPAPARPLPEILSNAGGPHQRIGMAQWLKAREDVPPPETFLANLEPRRD